MNHAHLRSSDTQRGVTLLELVITIALVAIGSAAVVTLLVNSFDFIESNEQISREVRTAETCYETVLAIHETEKWARMDGSTEQQVPIDRTGEAKNKNSPTAWLDLSADASTANAYIDDSDPVARDAARDAFITGCSETKQTPGGGDLRIRGFELDGKPATHVQIAVAGDRTLDVILPMDEAVTPGGGNGKGEGKNK